MMVPSRLSAVFVGLVCGPVWWRGTVLLMFGAALAGLCWWLVLLDLQQSMPAKSTARQVEEARLIERRVAVQKAQAQQASVTQQKEQLAALESALPAGDDAQGAWAAVHEASRQHGLRMEQFKPGPVGSETPYPQQRATLRLSGSFDALLALAQTLAETSSAVSLESYGLVSQASPGVLANSSAGSGSLVLEATLLSLHRLAPKAVPAAVMASAALGSEASRAPPAVRVQNTADLDRASIDAPPAAAVLSPELPRTPGDPFESRRLASLPASEPGALNTLSSLPLSAMRMVGSVRAANPSADLTALVSMGGSLHAVRVGDALGNARGRVAEIRADGLTVREPGSPGSAQPARIANLLIAKD